MGDAPILFVTGLGRCGTSMVMQMLHAAGVPCAGTPPAFEDVPVSPRGVDHDWLAGQCGRAVKWIDPTVTRLRPPPGQHGAIFLSRDPMQQALSQLKLLAARHDRNTRRAMKKQVEADSVRACVIVQRLFGVHYVQSLYFERIIDRPKDAARKMALLCDTLGLPFGSEDAAAAVVIRRSPLCAPDLAIEHAAIRRAGT